MSSGLFGNPLFYIVLLVAAGAIGFYYLKGSHGKGGGSKDNGIDIDDEDLSEVRDKKGRVLVRVYDNKLLRVYNSVISKQAVGDIKTKCGTLGRQWNREGKSLYAINRYQAEDNNWELRPVLPPSHITYPPTSLHNDLQQPEIGIMFTEMLKADDNDKSFIEKYKHILIWIVGMAFLAFMWSQAPH